LGVRLTPAFCKLLLGEVASFDDLKSELPDEYEWIKGVKDAMAQAAAAAGAENAAAAACAAADAKLHVGEEGCGRLLVTPSPKNQVFQSMKLFRQTNAADDDGALELLEERCLLHAARLPDEEASTNIAWLSSLSDDAVLCGDNFDLYVDGVVQQQLVMNTADIFQHIYPAFQAAARQGDDDVAEVTPDYMSHYLGGASAVDLQHMFSGRCTRRDFVFVFVTCHVRAAFNAPLFCCSGFAGDVELTSEEFIHKWKAFSRCVDGRWCCCCDVAVLFVSSGSRLRCSRDVVKWFWEILAESSHEYRLQVFQWCAPPPPPSPPAASPASSSSFATGAAAAPRCP
jgi:hypothetical protein